MTERLFHYRSAAQHLHKVTVSPVMQLAHLSPCQVKSLQELSALTEHLYLKVYSQTLEEVLVKIRVRIAKVFVLMIQAIVPLLEALVVKIAWGL